MTDSIRQVETQDARAALSELLRSPEEWLPPEQVFFEQPEIKIAYEKQLAGLRRKLSDNNAAEHLSQYEVVKFIAPLKVSEAVQAEFRNLMSEFGGVFNKEDRWKGHAIRLMEKYAMPSGVMLSPDFSSSYDLSNNDPEHHRAIFLFMTRFEREILAAYLLQQEKEMLVSSHDDRSALQVMESVDERYIEDWVKDVYMNAATWRSFDLWKVREQNSEDPHTAAEQQLQRAFMLEYEKRHPGVQDIDKFQCAILKVPIHDAARVEAAIKQQVARMCKTISGNDEAGQGLQRYANQKKKQYTPQDVSGNNVIHMEVCTEPVESDPDHVYMGVFMHSQIRSLVAAYLIQKDGYGRG